MIQGMFGPVVLLLATSPPVPAASSQDSRPPIVLETELFRYTIGPDGKNREFRDKADEVDYAVSGSFFAELTVGGDRARPSSVAMEEGRLVVTFAGTETRATLAVNRHPRHLELEVASITGEADSLVFLDVPLRLRGTPSEPFGACALALNLFTRVDQLPALQTRLRASCYRRFGIIGAKVALVGAPPNGMLPILRDVIRRTKDLPQTTLSGPWAKDVPFNRGSYLFNFGALTEQNVDEWIAMVKSLGFNQIDSHGGSRFFRFGDLQLNEEKWPRGWDSYRSIVSKLHAHDIGAILHTYAFFIDKGSKYVTPVPHAQLDAFRTFTLAEPVSADQRELVVREPTDSVSTVTGFFVRNSVTLHLGDELITFGGVSQNPPYRFTGCGRGAYGTRASPHPRGATARHLKECFGLFVPDAESELFTEIAGNHARVINTCDFDGLYLDAIDGSDILRGSESSWYYASKFLYAIWEQLDHPIGMEMSAMWHHFWQFRSRWQAWDYPNRGHKRFIDLHASAVNGGLLLPLHLGWWNFQTFSPPQVEPSFPDVIEYLGAKMIGHDAGVSLTGAVDRARLKEVPAVRRLAALLRRYEEIRRADTVEERVKARLREPGRDFTLFADRSGKWRFRPARYDRHKVQGVDSRSSNWDVANEFAEQPLKARVELLMAAGPYDRAGSIPLADTATAKQFEPGGTAPGVSATLEPADTELEGRRADLAFSATNTGPTPRRGSWARFKRPFEPALNLSQHQALGLWVHGDGQGELLNFRLESPRHIAHGAIADRYVVVDFRGWRYVELIETESARYSDYSWPDGWALYHVYRELVNFGKIDSLSVWYQNLPPKKDVLCHLTSVRALPMLPATIRNPRLEVGGRAVVVPVEMRSGHYLELSSASDCKLYGPQGEPLGEVSLEGEVPLLRHGNNHLTFSCESTEKELTPRVQVTIISYGDPL